MPYAYGVGLDRNGVRFWTNGRRKNARPSSSVNGAPFEEDERRALSMISRLRARLTALLVGSTASWALWLCSSLSQAVEELAPERRGRLLAVGLGGGLVLLGLALGSFKLYVAPLLKLTEQALTRLSAIRRRSGSELALARCALHELLRVSVQPFEPAARDKGLTLELVILPDLPKAVQLDAARVQQVLAHLIDDAIQHTDAGGVKIQVDAINLTEQRFDLRVRVEDTSIGVPAPAPSAPFDGIARRSAGAARAEAVGRGLSMCRQLVSSMHGELDCPEADGAGRVFQVVIPVTRLVEPSIGPSASLPAEPQLLLLRLPSPTAPILIVDDEEADRRVAIELLEDLGFEVEVATGGARAIELVSRGKHALILMDCQMPEVDGYTAARRIRALEAPQNGLPIIACAARAEARERSEVLAAGMDDTLVKPLQRAALCNILARWLSDEKNPASSGLRLTAAAAHASAAREGPTLDLMPLRRSERLVDLFVAQVPEEVRAIALSVDAARLADVAARATKLKGICQRTGAMKMVALCAALEGAGSLSKAELLANVKALGESLLLVLTLLGEERPKSERASAPSSREPNSEA